MKKVVSLALLLCMFGPAVNGQTIAIDKQEAQGFAAIAPENIYVHFNTTLLFPAEYLYYKVYCFDLKAKVLSDISKMAYVELINENLEVVFRHKVRLQKGKGQGDYFVPVSLPSGNYKLIAYTNWMKNFGKAYFFENDISIINPYQADQKAIMSVPVKQVDSLKDSVAVKDAKVLNPSRVVHTAVGPIKIGIGKRTYSKRSEVRLVLNSDSDLASGNYSLSVRQKDSLPQHERIPMNSGLIFAKAIEGSFDGSSILHLPEFRGELLSGRVMAIKEGISIANQNVAISLPGKEYQFKIAQTNAEGVYYINLDKAYSGDQVIVQALGKNRFGLDVQWDQPVSPDYSQMAFKKLKIGQQNAESIRERSIHNQIESAYFRFKPDSILPTTHVLPFADQNVRNYDMADYTDFRSVREALLEIIKDVWVRRNTENGEEIEVKSMDLISNPDLLPLVIVDGIIVQEHESLLDYDARNLSTIRVFRDKYVFGPQIFQGAIVFETKKSDYDQNVVDSNIKRFQMLKPQLRKHYFTQRYDAPDPTTAFSLPDDRLQLLWKPQVILNGKKDSIRFFTSDVTGEFEVDLEGILDTGEPVSIRETFFVE
ncbi:MAG: hypothetical protein WBM98_08500 [Maribacter sp.]|uniref:hypothetical protein n=1 Tax=Maribacter sp. TaxID=1897614 RepID=UPI003C75A742